MTSAPAVSVIVPAWGVAHLVGETLASLQGQAFDDWEAIVVDDGDPTVAPVVALMAEADPRIRFVAIAHGGLPWARNHAIAAARAPLIALLDGDDLHMPTYLDKMVTAISTDPAPGVVTCDAIFAGDTLRAGRRFSDYLPQGGAYTLDAVIARRANVFIASIVRRDVMDAVGGFDEELPAAEDLDLWIRITEAGWSITHLPEPLVLYRRRPGSLSASTLKLRLAAASVYDKAAARLAGRPEAATAATMASTMRDEAGWVEGEDMVIAGHIRAGIAMLRQSHAERRSGRWRVMMPLFSALPPLARPLLAWRRRRELAER
ncbi:glycosyltransferase family 2 protein [Sphingomonas oryzagri]